MEKIKIAANMKFFEKTNQEEEEESNFKIKVNKRAYKQVNYPEALTMSSLSSNESSEIEDDDYFELMEMEGIDEEDTQMPADLGSLLHKDVKTTDLSALFDEGSLDGAEQLQQDEAPIESNNCSVVSIPKFKRVVSLFATPPDRHCLATINENVLTPTGNKSIFKRPDPPTLNTSQSKRHKGEKPDLLPSIVPIQTLPTVKRPPLRKTLSMNDANTIMQALSRSNEEDDLIGDFSKKFCLPYIDGRHKDLRSISSTTMRQLLQGDFDSFLTSYKVIDCRFPYEFEGGHIRGALNLYTQEQIIEELVNKPNVQAGGSDDERHILIFHCEFSSERGPKLSRFLRNHDRMSSPYPTLRYPEIYLLHGGYKEFYQNNSDLCEPNAYRMMLDSNYTNEYRHFRAKSKSWTDGRSSNRLLKSRSKLVL